MLHSHGGEIQKGTRIWAAGRSLKSPAPSNLTLLGSSPRVTPPFTSPYFPDLSPSHFFILFLQPTSLFFLFASLPLSQLGFSLCQFPLSFTWCCLLSKPNWHLHVASSLRFSHILMLPPTTPTLPSCRK